jgi:AraC-like DNA-binding protein
MTAVDAWSVESGDSRRVFAADRGLALFAETDGAWARPHAHPAWKVVVGLTGTVELARPGRSPLVAPGIAVPPERRNEGGSRGPYIALYVDPWRVRADPSRGPITLDEATVRRVVDACGVGRAVDGPVPDLGEGRLALDGALGAAPVLDPRVAHVLDRLSGVDRLDELAGEVGLSPSRLRAVVRSTVGIPLGRMRQWARLRAAVGALGRGVGVADAAHLGGFADQSHLTRTAGRLVGRTPASLAGGGRPAPDRRLVRPRR